MKRQLLTMQILRWMLLALTLALVSAQSIGPNYGITLRLTPKGLNFAGTAAATNLMYRFRRLPNISRRSGIINYSATSMRFSRVTPPKVEVLPGHSNRNPSAKMTIEEIIIDGNVRARRIFLQRSGSFQIRVRRVSVETVVKLSKTSSGKPKVEYDSCSSNILSFTFTRRSGGVIGGMVSEERIRGQLQAVMDYELCFQVRAFIPRLNVGLSGLQTLIRVHQDNQLVLDTKLIRDPTPRLFFIDTVLKGDWEYRTRRIGADNPERIHQFNYHYHLNKMAIFYITDYFINAVGVLLNRFRRIEAVVTREQVSSFYRPWLALSCTSFVCAGSIFPDLRARYPDGWLEVDLRATSAPTAELRNNRMTGNFVGAFTLYVKRPDGSRTEVASGSAKFSVGVDLSIRNIIIHAAARSPSITVTRARSITTAQARRILVIYSSGFVLPRLNELGRNALVLPSIRGVTFRNPTIEIGDGLLRVVTDLNFRLPTTG